MLPNNQIFRHETTLHLHFYSFTKLMLMICFLHFSLAYGQQIQLVKNIRKTDGGYSSSPDSYTSVGDLLFFSAQTYKYGRELWAMDAKSEEPYLVKDIRPGNTSSDPNRFIPFGDQLVFILGYGTTHEEIWISDGTEQGTFEIRGIGEDYSRPRSLMVYNDALYFVAEGVTDKTRKIWRTNETKDSAYSLNIFNFSSAFLPVDFTVNSGRFYMRLFKSGFGSQLWYMDENEQLGLVRDTLNRPVKIIKFTIGGDSTLYFEGLDSLGRNGGLWRTDQTGVVAQRVTSEDKLQDSLFIGAKHGQRATGMLYFTIKDYFRDAIELWRSNGTVRGTYRITTAKEITHLTSFNGSAYFSGWTNEGIRGLWRISEEKTHSEVEYVSTSFSTSGMQLASAPNMISDGQKLYFFLEREDKIQHLACLDTGGLNVRILRDFGIKQYVQLNWGKQHKNVFYFSARDSINGNEIWKIDNSQDSMYMVKNLNYIEIGCNARELTALNQQLLFSANDGVHGQELWTSTATGATMLVDLAEGHASGYPSHLTYVNQKVLFTAASNEHGNELWVTEGSMKSTRMLKEFTPGVAGSEFRQIVSQGRQAFFTVVNGSALELWVSNGTEHGTKRVVNFSKGATIQIFPGQVSKVYIVEILSNTSFKIWVSDGSSTGTYALKQFCPCTETPIVDEFIEYDGHLYFTVLQGVEKVLWTADIRGQQARFIKHSGKPSPSQLAVFNNEVHFIGRDENNGIALWRTNATEEGTVQVSETLVGPRQAYLSSTRDKMYFLTKNKLFGTTNIWFYSRDDELRLEPPHQFIDVNPMVVTTVNNALYFSGSDGVSGYELWHSDGTVDSTYMVEDLTNGPGDSRPEDFKRVGNRLYFTAIGNDIGRELYYINVPENSTYSEDKEISVFPNPAINETVIVSNEEYNGKPLQVDLYDLNGQQLFSTQVKSNALTLDVSTYPPAIYIIHINDAHSLKLVKL